MLLDTVENTADPVIITRAVELNARLADADPKTVIEAALREMPGRLAVVSSFGTESAVLLDLVADFDRAIPILFLDTGQLFRETIDYRDMLIDRLGLTDVRTFAPDADEVRVKDQDGFLWQSDPDACCTLRKVEPLASALGGFDAWINGRKRYQAETRQKLPLVEVDDARLKFNPMASWGRDEIKAYFERNKLPRHPMESMGFPSIGCMPCTSRVSTGENPRAGRWRGRGKVECGIHVK